MLFIQQIPMKSQAFGSNAVSQNKLRYAVLTNKPQISLVEHNPSLKICSHYFSNAG